jgi:hypothetical protein
MGRSECGGTEVPTIHDPVGQGPLPLSRTFYGFIFSVEFLSSFVFFTLLPTNPNNMTQGSRLQDKVVIVTGKSE